MVNVENVGSGLVKMASKNVCVAAMANDPNLTLSQQSLTEGALVECLGLFGRLRGSLCSLTIVSFRRPSTTSFLSIPQAQAQAAYTSFSAWVPPLQVN